MRRVVDQILKLVQMVGKILTCSFTKSTHIVKFKNDFFIIGSFVLESIDNFLEVFIIILQPGFLILRVHHEKFFTVLLHSLVCLQFFSNLQFGTNHFFPVQYHFLMHECVDLSYYTIQSIVILNLLEAVVERNRQLTDESSHFSGQETLTSLVLFEVLEEFLLLFWGHQVTLPFCVQSDCFEVT